MKASRQTDSTQRRETHRFRKTLFSLAWLHRRNTSGSTATDLGRGMNEIKIPTSIWCLRTRAQFARLYTTCVWGVVIFDSHELFSDRRLSVRVELTAYAYLRWDVTSRTTFFLAFFLWTSVVSRPFLLWKLLSLSFEVSVTLFAPAFSVRCSIRLPAF